MSAPSKTTGTVKWFNDTKGYGFIAPADGTKDVFVHISALEKANLDGLSEGEKVEFDTEPGRKPGQGPQAVNLKVLGA